MKPPKKPSLNSLKGCTEISPRLRRALGIDIGILTGQVKHWNDIQFLVNSYFEQVENYNFEGNDLLNTILSTLGEISELKLVDENKKDGADRLVLVNDEAIMVPQAKLLKDYCRRVNIFLSSPTIKSTFLFQYAKAKEIKRKEEDSIRRQEAEKEEKDKMLHSGKMNAYLAAKIGSYGIREDLQAVVTTQETRNKREKGEERVVEEEERRTRARTISPIPAAPTATIDDNDVSFVTTSSGGTYEYQNDRDSDSPILAYVTSFDELTPITEENLFSLAYVSSNLPIAERLNISGIEFICDIDDNCFIPDALNNDITDMITKFIRAVEYNTHDMLLTPTKIQHINIISLLNSCFFNLFKENEVSKRNYKNYEAPYQVKNMENDFKIKYVVPFINAVFDVTDSLAVYWDKPLDIYAKSNMKLQRRQTTDALFATTSGTEIGVIEVKPFNTPPEAIEEDRIRLAEITKKILHRRIIAAKTNKELMTFAIMIAGDEIEYFIHQYKPAADNKTTKKYTLKLVKKSILPTFPSTFSRMSLSLECLFHFKKLMIDSIACNSDVTKPYLYKDRWDEFEPTVTILKLDD